MNRDLSNFRKNYVKHELLEVDLPKNPLELFKNWFEYMESLDDSIEVNAMTVSTIGKDGFPKNRVVLLKEFNVEGFVFYTNYESDKGRAIQDNPHVCISFFWPEVERQVVIKGIAEKASETEAVIYFKSRPRGSQLGAWASSQSREIASREVLEKSIRELEVRFEGKEIPKPDWWGGYIIKPLSYEFWQGRDSRLHDRIQYDKVDADWNFKRLAP
ncbi:pyridoxamine 5'-phosphate oxidase [Gillisia sp. M10.2A]|uniref:Pyridoxine/pyridoxamine 5'-phosphate oxidase n=1 Tax=Gillisia lutea TaxID=2909668 RepID=A0ABS9EH20_9FLAO|nr:pyridoxamine 5'-phosphate oxidase [Gillisia lutea]MCF4101439.1 pyridoxamine 5'-phosphate oxidase [Gillisia lutea]